MSTSLKPGFSRLSLWSSEAQKLFKDGLKLLSINVEEPEPPSNYKTDDTNKSEEPIFECPTCKVTYKTRDEQVSHYKQDWHHFNCYQRFKGRSVVSKEQYSHSLDAEKDTDSNSTQENSSDQFMTTFEKLSLQLKETSNQDTEADNTDNEGTSSFVLRHAKLFLISKEEVVFSMFRALVKPKKNAVDDYKELLGAAERIHEKQKWAYILLSGGCFAGAVFEGDKVIVHKTLKCYNKRGKQGKFQTANDNKYNRASRSAGASLRRENIAHFKTNLREVICSWAKTLEECDLVFYRTPGNVKELLFGGKEPLLNKRDPRMRTIPVPVTKPVFKEVLRVHQLLSAVEVYGTLKEVTDSNGVPDPRLLSSKKAAAIDVDRSRETKSPPKKRNNHIDRAKSRSPTFRPLPEEVHALLEDSDDSVGLIDEDYTFGNIDFSTLDPGLLVPSFSSDDDVEDVPLQTEATCVEEHKPPVKPERSKDTQTQEKIKDKQTKKKTKSKNNETAQEITLGPLESLLPGTRKQLFMYLHTKCSGVEFEILKSTCCLYEKEDSCSSEFDHSQCLKSSVDLSFFIKWATPLRITVEELLNLDLGHGRTCLHAAAVCDNPAIIRFLLNHGSDPALLDELGNPPFAISTSKEVRNEFRRFMADHPNRYDYQKAAVPSPLTKEMEEARAEKEKNQKKAKKQKQKLLKIKKMEAQKEEEEKHKFLELSDTDKCKLSAPNSMQRCFQCGIPLTKTPFEYSNFKFCTTVCVQAHRKALKEVKS